MKKNDIFCIKTGCRKKSCIHNQYNMNNTNYKKPTVFVIQDCSKLESCQYKKEN